MFQLKNVMWYYVIIFHVISCYMFFMLYHVVSCYSILYHVISCHSMLYHVITFINCLTKWICPQTKTFFQIKLYSCLKPNFQLFKGRCWYLVNKLKEKIVKKKIRSTTEKADQKNQEQTWTVCPVAWYGHLVRGNPKKTDMWK